MIVNLTAATIGTGERTFAMYKWEVLLILLIAIYYDEWWCFIIVSKSSMNFVTIGTNFYIVSIHLFGCSDVACETTAKYVYALEIQCVWREHDIII